MQRLCVFTGSSTGADPRFTQQARVLGERLAGMGVAVVYGGGRVGLMGELADACLAAGGEVIGVIPRFLMEWEVGHRGVTTLHQVETMHERKALMAELSDGFLAMPGGIGTMEELFEVWTWSQLGSHGKPVALLDVAGYYQLLVAFADHMVDQGFLHAHHRQLLLVDDDIGALLERMRRWTPAEGPGKLPSDRR